MNTPIVRIYVLVLLLLATLVYFTSKWAGFDVDELEAERANRRPLIESQQIPRGSITSARGVLIAESLPEGGGRKPVFVRRYPQGSLFGNPVGYSFVEVEQSGIEDSENTAFTPLARISATIESMSAAESSAVESKLGMIEPTNSRW